MSSTTSKPTTTAPAPAKAPAPAADTDAPAEGGGGWLEGVKKAAISKYDNFKARDPETAAKLEGAVETVAKTIDDFNISHTEKAAIQKMDDCMAKLEADYQCLKTKAHEEWQSLKSQDAAKAAEIRASIQQAQEQVAAAKKTAMLNMQQTMESARTEVVTTCQKDYAAAKQSATTHYNELKTADAAKAKKVQDAMADAETKLTQAKEKCTAKYEKTLTEASTELAAAEKEATEEYDKAVASGTQTLDACKATATKEATVAKTKAFDAKVAANNKAAAISSNLQASVAQDKTKALAACDKLQAYDAAKAEEIEKKVRDVEVKIAAAKKSAMEEYQKALKDVTKKLQKLSTS